MLRRSRLLLLTLLLGLGTLAAAATRSQWSPFLFDLDPVAPQLGLDMALDGGEAAATQIAAEYPGFVSGFAAEFTHLYRRATERMFMPNGMSFDSPFGAGYESAPEAARGLLEAMTNFTHGFGASIYAALARRYTDIDQTPAQAAPYQFAYCQQHPEFTAYPCNGQNPGRRLETFLTKLIANPYVIRFACDGFAQVAAWQLRYAELEAQGLPYVKDQPTRLAFDRLRSMLAYLENGGSWNVSEEFTNAWDPDSYYESTYQFLLRRYYDGGPRAMKAYAQCLDKVEAARAADVGGRSPEATKLAQDLLRFQLRPELGADVAVSTLALDDERLYRAFHRLPTSLQLPAGVADFVRYQGQAGQEWDPIYFYVLARWLSFEDPVYNYRLITHAELKRLFDARAAGADVPVKNSYYLAVNQDYLSVGFKNAAFEYVAPGNLDSPDTAYYVRLGAVLLVRVRK